MKTKLLLLLALPLCGCATRARVLSLEYRVYSLEDGQGIHECTCTCPEEKMSRAVRADIARGGVSFELISDIAARNTDKSLWREEQKLLSSNASLKAIIQNIQDMIDGYKAPADRRDSDGVPVGKK